MIVIAVGTNWRPNSFPDVKHFSMTAVSSLDIYGTSEPSDYAGRHITIFYPYSLLHVGILLVDPVFQHFSIS